MIPFAILKKRHDICQQCAQVSACVVKNALADLAPACPLDKLPTLADELTWARAWPEGVQAVSGCCDRMG